MADILYIVIPCYNEEEVLYETSQRLKQKVNTLIDNNRINYNSKIVFVNDGSTDKTWQIISRLHQQNKIFSGINLSKNFGHQNALLAGLTAVIDFADMVISMDADLQDDIEAIDEMLNKYYLGNDVVYGVRNSRDTDSFFKRSTAKGYYTLMNVLGAQIIFNHADYRLMSKRAIAALSEFKEINLFLRGIIPLIGYPSDIVTYDRNKRFAGKSKYPFKKMISFALEGITSFSILPIRLITFMGITIFCISLFMLVYFILQYILGNTVPGWATLAVSVWGIGGLQLFSIGIIGEYIGKIYLETKKRPRYIIEQFLNDN